MRAIFITNNFYADKRLYKGIGPLKKIVDEVIFIAPEKATPNRFLERVTWRLGLPVDQHKINKKLIQACAEKKVDLVFVMKGNYLYPKTLKIIKRRGIKLISYSLDDLFLRRNHSLFFKYGIKYYDIVVTTKSLNLKPDEFKKWGAKNILFQYQAFDEEIHKPCKNCNNCKFAHDTVFVGSYEKERHEYIEFLADNKIKIHIYSPGWKDKVMNKEFLIVHDNHLYLDDFACALGCSKIALNFLRKINRDLHTSRSFEIPACGGFMLAERTSEHQQLFIEGKEAEYFSSKEELLQKVNKYLLNKSKRNEIAAAGYAKCVLSGYTYVDRFNEILKYLFNK